MTGSASEPIVVNNNDYTNKGTTACAVCLLAFEAEKILTCDSCNVNYHHFCVGEADTSSTFTCQKCLLIVSGESSSSSGTDSDMDTVSEGDWTEVKRARRKRKRLETPEKHSRRKVSKAPVVPASNTGAGENSSHQTSSKAKSQVRQHFVNLGISATDGKALNGRVNYNEMCDQIAKLAGKGKIVDQRWTGRGDVIVVLVDTESAEALKALTRIGTIPIKTYYPGVDGALIGRIKQVDRHLSDAEMLELLKEYGVIKVQRETVHFKANDGTVVEEPRNVVRLFFDTPTLPEKVRLGHFQYQVWEYIAPPSQCYKCQRFGHMADRGCRWPLACRKCAGNHDAKNCTSGFAQCANCGQGHYSSHKQCPVRQTKILEHRRRLQKPASFQCNHHAKPLTVLKNGVEPVDDRIAVLGRRDLRPSYASKVMQPKASAAKISNHAVTAQQSASTAIPPNHAEIAPQPTIPLQPIAIEPSAPPATPSRVPTLPPEGTKRMQHREKTPAKAHQTSAPEANRSRVLRRRVKMPLQQAQQSPQSGESCSRRC